jgi:hypothetical protein
VPDDGFVHNLNIWTFWIRKILYENTVVFGGPLVCLSINASQWDTHISPTAKLRFVVTEACNLLAQLFVHIYPHMLISASENKFLAFRHAVRILLHDGKP